ncbi:MAG: amino acid adenylation domain-containing protein, partial [bacterium]|nr:amino acid adenylation domain-containing protein [bacterium]
KTGAAYLPIDPDSPVTRLRYMLKDSNCRLLLTHQTFTRNLPGECETLTLHQHYNDAPELTDTTDVTGNNTAPGPAYVIYTSGSTGNPKGVIVGHHSVINLVEGLKERVYNFKHSIKVALLSPYIFDASVKQIFPSLLLGHTLVIVPGKERFDGEKLIRYYREKDITVSDGTPTHLNILLEHPSLLEQNFPVERFVIGGEELPPRLVDKIIKTTAKRKTTVFNVYGPTECCDVSTVFKAELKELEKHHSIPIGKPIANVELYILGKHRELLPPGSPGELYIAGAGLSYGYLNNPQLTALRFVPSPFKKNAQLYRTGDLTRRLPDGNIEFLGRVDYQVKIRGFRIETGEIETCLTRFSGINETLVCAGQEDGSEKYLCAYFTSNRTIETMELRQYLMEYLPHYMIPTYFIPMDEFPLTANGKIDRKSLPRPIIRKERNYVPPGNDVENRLAGIWAEVLNLDVDTISTHADFFQLGGNSI